MCWLQQFTSYYSPVRHWARQHLILWTGNGLLTSLAGLPKLTPQHWFWDSPVVQPDTQFLQRTGLLQRQANKPSFTSSSEAQALPMKPPPVAKELLTETKTWTNTTWSIQRGPLREKSILWYLTQHYFFLTTSLGSQHSSSLHHSGWQNKVTGHHTAFPSTKGIKGIFLQNI